MSRLQVTIDSTPIVILTVCRFFPLPIPHSALLKAHPTASPQDIPASPEPTCPLGSTTRVLLHVSHVSRPVPHQSTAAAGQGSPVLRPNPLRSFRPRDPRRKPARSSAPPRL